MVSIVPVDSVRFTGRPAMSDADSSPAVMRPSVGARRLCLATRSRFNDIQQEVTRLFVRGQTAGL